MLNIVFAVAAMAAVLVLLSDRKLKVTYVLKFFLAVSGASALLVFLNMLCGFWLTDFFGLAAAVFIVLAVRYACGMRFRKVVFKRGRDEDKEEGKNRAA